ncbi:MAG TPA: hypothetical protein VGE04_14730 [Chloroflexia bacterium]|jgi:hypothetical protein
MTSAPYSADNADSHRVTTPQMVQPRNVNSPPGVGEVLQQTGAGQATKPILLTDGVPDPKQVGVEWFAPTGHTLRGSFLEYWRNNGGLAQFGYPLTEEFADPLGPDGELIVVQYFERNRFEHHPENAGTQYEVLLGVLGRAFRQQDPPSTPLPSPAIYFQQTGHNLSGTFKAYWESHGGLTLHGYPITEEFEEQSPTDGKTYRVQYFERSRFELHPEYAGTPYEVLLGQLGTQLSQKDGYPYGWYPTYGHAADFSWVSGRLLPPKACPGPECVCTFYSQPNNVDLRVTPVGPAYSTAHREGLILHYPQLIVIFGHMAQPGESVPTTICPYPKFIVSQVQRNPADKAWSE